jgi:hypothetical protein
LGIIETISAGFSLLIKRVWLALIPIALDLFLWLGPKLSIAPVIAKTLVTMRAAAESFGSTTTDPNVTEMMNAMFELLQQGVGTTNFMALLAWGRLGVPSVAGLKPIEPGIGTIIELSGYGQMLLVQLVIMALGLLVACVFLGLLAQAVRGENLDLAGLVNDVPTYWLHMAAVLAPFGLFLIFAISLSLFFGPLSIFVLVGVIWLMIYMSFFPHAVTLMHQKPLHALSSTFRLVRSNFWSTIGLLVLVNLLSTGLGLIWARLVARSAITMLVAILANAYVGTGLTLALFIFFRDRMALLQQAQSHQRSA